MSPIGTPIDVTKADNYLPYREAIRVRRPLGFVFNGDGIVGIDFDKWSDREPVLEDFGNTYIEESPSGTGLHVIGRCHDLSQVGNRTGNVEVYGNKRFFTITGKSLAGHVVAPIDIQKLLKYISVLSDSDRELIDRIRKTDSMQDDFAALYERGTHVKYRSHSELDLALCNLLSFWTSDPLQIDRIIRQSALMRDKWDEKRGSGTYGSLTIERALRSRREPYSGRTTTEKGTHAPGHGLVKSADLVISRLTEMVHQEQNAMYLDLGIVTGGVFRTFPGNMLVLTADTGMNKSVYMQNLIHKATKPDGSRLRTLIFNSEMNDEFYMRRQIQIALGASKHEVFDLLRGRIPERLRRLYGEDILPLVSASTESIQFVDKSEPVTLARLIQMIELNNPELLLLDTIDGIEVPDSGTNTYHEDRTIARGLSRICQKYNLILVCVAHLSKQGMKDKNKDLPSIKGPTDLPQKADQVILMEGDRNTSWRLIRSLKARDDEPYLQHAFVDFGTMRMCSQVAFNKTGGRALTTDYDIPF